MSCCTPIRGVWDENRSPAHCRCGWSSERNRSICLARGRYNKHEENAMRQEEAASGERHKDQGGPTPAPNNGATTTAAPASAALAALCVVARFHQVAAEPDALRHQLSLGASATAGVDDLLLAAKHLGLKAKLSRTSTDRLTSRRCPRWPLMHDGSVAVLAQCDGQRVLLQHFGDGRRVASADRAARRLRGAVERGADPHHQPRQPRRRAGEVRFQLVHPQPGQVPPAARRGAGRVACSCSSSRWSPRCSSRW